MCLTEPLTSGHRHGSAVEGIGAAPVNMQGNGTYADDHKCECTKCKCQTKTKNKICSLCSKESHA
nr:uncharacterized protein I203_03336 [Kwoniella mangroviensis CBS 8507]OCF67639.1 hypothetical protein I203_03336 [Kwoniella mangroviensis CBS 8507]